jgi:DNA-binding response OmpR family regulator
MGHKLLLVEDDPAIAAMLMRAMRCWGYDTVHAADSAAAARIAEIEGVEIGVALCDLVLPDGSGEAAADAIRSHCAGVWIIFTSGYPVDVLTERGLIRPGALQAAGTSYLPKPFLPRDVRDMVGCALLTKVERAGRVAYAAAAY